MLFAKIERGIDGPALKPTQDDFVTGVAMSAPVIIEGVAKTHLVLFSGVIAPIAEPEHEDHNLARYILIHECGHIHDLAQQDKAFGERLLKPEPTTREHLLQTLASDCWSEYAACRLSGGWAHDKQTEWLENTFCACLEGLRMRGKEALRQYQDDRQVDKLLSFISVHYGKVMKYASYLLGHLRGQGLSVAEAAPKAAAIVEKKIFFREIFQRLETCLDTMWSNYGDWTDITIFDPLKALVDDCLKVGGITLETMPDGRLYVHVSRDVTLFSSEDE